MVEILIVMTILIALFTISVVSYGGTRSKKSLDTAVNLLLSDVELQKVNAQTGKGGEDHGIRFFDDSYVLFEGNVFDSESSSNVTRNIHERYSLSTDIPGEDIIIFNRLTGRISEESIITFTDLDQPGRERKVKIRVSGSGEVIDQIQ